MLKRIVQRRQFENEITFCSIFHHQASRLNQIIGIIFVFNKAHLFLITFGNILWFFSVFTILPSCSTSFCNATSWCNLLWKFAVFVCFQSFDCTRLLQIMPKILFKLHKYTLFCTFSHIFETLLVTLQIFVQGGKHLSHFTKSTMGRSAYLDGRFSLLVFGGKFEFLTPEEEVNKTRIRWTVTWCFCFFLRDHH